MTGPQAPPSGRAILPCMKRLTPVLLFGGTVGLCLAFRPNYLPAWDAIQLALGLERFDMALHQPHPPGYLGPMAIAWLFYALGLPPDQAMQAQSVLCTALAAVALWWLGGRLGTSWEGLLAALMFVIHPVTLFYAVSGETYPAEALTAVLLVGAGLGVRKGMGAKHVAAFFALYGLSGGVRQSLPLFFLPNALWRLTEVWRGRRRLVLVAGLSSLAGALAWALPLMWLAGGPGPLVDHFGTQFFRLFGAQTSPLMGAPRSAVLHNLDLLWRFTIENLSASGLAAVVLLVASRLRPLRTDALGGLLVAWVLPAFLWFGLMFVYKSGHLLVLVPAFALVSARAVTRGIESFVLVRAVAGAVVLAQAGLFLAPPEGWIRTVGGRSWPALQHGEVLTAETIEALRRLAGGRPERVLVITRDARFDFRTAMFYLPEMRVVWLLDHESTGAARAGVLACEAVAHEVRCASGQGFWTGEAWPKEAQVQVGPEVRYVVWFCDPAGPFHREVRRAVLVRDVRFGRLATLEVTDLEEVASPQFQIGAVRFVRSSPWPQDEEGTR